jgi:scyllo-inositol 2-dehydrogenase (NADP+)
MSKTVNVGIIGFGLGGRVFHAPIINCITGFSIMKIRETKKDNIQIINTRYPDVKVVSDAQEIIDDPEIDLVAIVTPNIYHHSLAKAAMLAGKHVVIDKPVTITSEEADDLIALSQKLGKVLAVHHNRRWDSNSLTIEKILKSNVLGRVVEFEAHYDRFRNFIRTNSWKEEDAPGTGILYDLGVHLFYQAIYFFGLPQEVTGDLRAQRTGGKTVDNFEVVLHYPGLKVTLKAGLLVRELGPSIVILGEQGSYVKHGMDIQEQALMEGQLPNEIQNWGKEPETMWGKLNTDINGIHVVGKVESEPGDYRKFYQNVFNAITEGEELLINPQDARNTVRIVELAIKSSAEKRTVKFE